MWHSLSGVSQKLEPCYAHKRLAKTLARSFSQQCAVWDPDALQITQE